MERLVLGTLIGAVGGFLAGVFQGEMEGVLMLALVLIPFFALVGGAAGVLSKKYGWPAVRVLIWAMAASILLKVLSPAGWVIGGIIGGLINGFSSRWRYRVPEAVLWGLLVGWVGWSVTSGYVLVALALCFRE